MNKTIKMSSQLVSAHDLIPLPLVYKAGARSLFFWNVALHHWPHLQGSDVQWLFFIMESQNSGQETPIDGTQYPRGMLILTAPLQKPENSKSKSAKPWTVIFCNSVFCFSVSGLRFYLKILSCYCMYIPMLFHKIYQVCGTKQHIDQNCYSNSM